MIRIDAHVHMGVSWLGSNRARINADDILRIYDKYEIQYGCLSAWQVGYDFWAGNEETLQIWKKNPDRWIPLAIVGPRDGKLAVDLIKKYAEEYGWKGIKIHPSCNQFRVDNEWLMDPIMEACRKYNMFIQIHSNRDMFADATMISTLAARHPDVRIIMAHIGNSVGHAWIDAINAAIKNPNLYLDSAASLNSNYTIPLVIEACGCEKLFFGSDLPYSNFAPEIEKIFCCDMQGYNITQYQKDMVLGGSMAKFLGIDPQI